MNTPNPYAPPRAAVSDVADPNAGAAMADRGTRLIAAILDGIIFTAMVYIPLLIGGALTGAFSAAAQSAASGGRPNIAGIYFGVGGLCALIGLVIWAWITIIYVSRNGQTIGKKMLSIKVTRKDGSKASLGRIFWLRNFVNALLGIIPLYSLVDILLIFGEPRQCIHDKLADTIVVKA
jgi:uncharacterized RDD family membrane protein YckC